MLEKYGNLISAVIAAVVAALGTYFTMKSKKVEVKEGSEIKFRDQLISQVEFLTVQINDLRADNNKLHSLIVDLKLENQKLSIKIKEQFNYIEIIKSYYEHMPVPAWMKDVDSRMFFINSQFERVFDITKTQYQSRTDTEIWGPEIGKMFKEGDLEAINNRNGITRIENIPVDMKDHSKGYNKWKVIKYPIFIDGKVFGVGGIAIDKLNDKVLYEK